MGLVVLKPSRRLLTKAKLGLAACAAGLYMCTNA